MTQFKSSVSNYLFSLLLVLAVLLAWIFPAIGAGDGMFSLSSLANYGISVIFFFYGLKLNGEKLRNGLGAWKLHLIIQLATFVLFPAIVSFFIFFSHTFFGSYGHTVVWSYGLFYVAALPSTVSSSVVLVSMAKGNIPAAIFNASISSIAGIFITPLWMNIMLSNDAAFEVSGLLAIIGKLALQILTPLTLGILLNKRLKTFAQRNECIYFVLQIIYK